MEGEEMSVRVICMNDKSKSDRGGFKYGSETCSDRSGLETVALTKKDKLNVAEVKMLRF